ncbi:MAG: cysteine desulfurase [Leifsonia xyli]|nr:MAG: cysteine desulfurase [Leifsonia xyli]
MEVLAWEWGSLLLRWLHIVAAMAWIGSSFFFMHLDASLKKTPEIPDGQGAAAWQVHGGGFYEMRKYFVAPGHLDPHLTWHKWQSYSTWLSGFVLLVWVYYAQSELYLIDPNVLDVSPVAAAGIGIGSLAVGWVIYDLICRSPLGRSELVLAAVGLVIIAAASYGFANLYSARGALIHTGALMATWMAGNVFFIIIPNQKKVVASLLANEAPDPSLGKQAKQRSAQNNYLTLPVILLMISNHYPILYGTAATLPVIVGLVTIAGAMVRFFYNKRHADHSKSPWWAWLVAGVAIVGAFAIALMSSPAGRTVLGVAAVEAPIATVGLKTAPPEEVVDVVLSRCSMCHAAQPAFGNLALPPKGVVLDTPDAITQHARAINYQTVLTHNMPPQNITRMPEEERETLRQWLAAQTH